MTTLVPFLPASTTAFTFQATFTDRSGNSASYNLIVTWNYAEQRYYLNCYNASGALVYCLAMVASPDTYGLNLNGGYFATTLVFRSSSQNFEIG